MNQSASRVRIAASTDTRIFVAGIAVFLALVVYLAVAFVNTHTTSGITPISVNHAAPWTPWGSYLRPIRLAKNGEWAVRVTPVTRAAARKGGYGTLVPTLVALPLPRHTYVVGLWLKGTRPGRIGVELNEFRGTLSRWPLERTVPATAKWHHYTLRLHVKRSWVGLAVYLYGQSNAVRRTWFEVRGLTVATR